MNSKDIADIFEEDEAYIQKLIDKIQANPTKDDTELCLMIFEEKYSGKWGHHCCFRPQSTNHPDLYRYRYNRL